MAVTGSASLVEILARRALEGVVTVARSDGSGLASTFKNALAEGLGVANVEGRLVVNNVVPALVQVDLSIVGPVVTKSPERRPATALVGRQMSESSDNETVLVGSLGLESQGVTARESGALEDGGVVNSEVDLIVAGDFSQALCLCVGLVLIDHEARVGIGVLCTMLARYIGQPAEDRDRDERPYIEEGELVKEVGVIVGIGQSKLSSNSTTSTGQEGRAKGAERRHFRMDVSIVKDWLNLDFRLKE